MHLVEIELNAKRICSDCIGERYLSNDVAATGVVAKCDYCDLTAATWKLEQLAARIETAFDCGFIRSTQQRG